MDERLKKLIEEAAEQNPELVEKFGNPLDEEDPRNWTPSKRMEEGISLEDQVKYLNLDVETSKLGFARLFQMVMVLQGELAKLQDWAAQQMANRFIELAKTDPDKAAAELKKMLGDFDSPAPGQWGPLEDSPEAGVKYAGSSKGIRPDQLVETPQGWIMGKDIPGYRDDPEWSPSPDWADANCMCPTHKARRESEKNQKPDDGFSGTGLYL